MDVKTPAPVVVPVAVPLPVAIPNTRKEFRWVVYAFGLCGAVMLALLIWQLSEMTPAKWCAVAELANPNSTTACLTLLLALVEVKDHAIIGLMSIVGASVIGLAVVALGVRIKADGPGGIGVEVTDNKVAVETANATVAVTSPYNSTGMPQ